MGTGRRLAAIALALIACAGLAATAGAELVQSGNVRVNFHASFAPIALPRDTPAPISVEVGGSISTTDGTQPPPLKEMKVELNSAGKIDARGLPVCSAPELQSTSSDLALERCGGARVGYGRFEARLQFSGRPIPVDGRALVFNGVVAGHTGMLIHIFIARPVRLTMVIPLQISHQSGRFQTVLTTRVPKLAGGFGSITELQLHLGRRFAYRGERHSFLSASCAAPKGFPGAIFSLARGNFIFAERPTMHANLVRNCKVRK